MQKARNAESNCTVSGADDAGSAPVARWKSRSEKLYVVRTDGKDMERPTRRLGIAVVVNKHRTLLGGVGIELASWSF